MTRAVTLGQRAYEAYWHAWPALALPWDRVTRQERRAWEAAAQAIVTAVQVRLVREEEA